MSDIDQQIIGNYLDTAVMHSQANNEFGEGLWLGRALEHAEQNAIDYEWLIREFEARALDTAIVRVPKPVGPQG